MLLFSRFDPYERIFAYCMRRHWQRFNVRDCLIFEKNRLCIVFIITVIHSCFFQSLENLKGSEKVMSSKKKSQQNSNVQNTPINKQTTEVKSRKRAQTESDPEELETGEKRAKGLRSSQTEAETNSAKRLKQPLTRSMLKKQKGR